MASLSGKIVVPLSVLERFAFACSLPRCLQLLGLIAEDPFGSLEFKEGEDSLSIYRKKVKVALFLWRNPQMEKYEYLLHCICAVNPKPSGYIAWVNTLCNVCTVNRTFSRCMGLNLCACVLWKFLGFPDSELLCQSYCIVSLTGLNGGQVSRSRDWILLCYSVLG